MAHITLRMGLLATYAPYDCPATPESLGMTYPPLRPKTLASTWFYSVAFCLPLMSSAICIVHGWERGGPRRIARMGELRARIEHLEGLRVAGERPGAEAGPIPPPPPHPPRRRRPPGIAFGTW
jgi:hypothetical protein